MDLHVAHLGDAQGVRDGVGELLEELAHLVGVLEVDFGGILHPVLIHEERTGPDADHDVVGVMVGLIEKVDVIRCDEPEPELAAEFPHLPGAGGLLGEAVVVHFQEKAVFPEDIDELPEALPRAVEVFILNELVDLAVDAAAQANEALGVRRERLLVDAGLVIHALEVTEAGQLHQVRVTLVRRGEQGDVRVALPLCLAPDGDGIGLFISQGHPRRREVGLAADDGLDPRLFRLLIKVDRPEDVAVIGHRDRRHLAALGLFHQLLDPHRPIEEGILGVQMKVNEGVGRHRRGGRAEVSLSL